MPPRLGFTKSRRGCIRCKQRRVKVGLLLGPHYHSISHRVDGPLRINKCDENLPCAACLRHGLECIRSEGPSARGRSSNSTRRSGRPKEQVTATSSHSPDTPIEPDPLASLSIFGAKETVLESGSQWRTDLRLMNHYTVVTWDTLPKGPGREKIWQLTLPEVAADYDFLMHQILAISASHIACVYPQERNSYSIQASQHQNTAIQGLRRVVPNVTEANCHAVFATASLLSIGALASHATQSSQGPTISDLLEIFSLIRGMHKILKDWEPIIEQGPLGQLLQLGEYDAETPLLRDLIRDLARLEVSSDVDLSTQLILKNEASMFVECIVFACRKSHLPELRALNIWPIYFSDDFFTLMQSRQSDAMTILEQYCRLLDSVGRDNWYIESWGKYVREDIMRGRQSV
jgi:hypothetical protein